MSGEAEAFPLVRMSPPLQLPAPCSRFCVCNLKRKLPHNANLTNRTNRTNRAKGGRAHRSAHREKKRENSRPTTDGKFDTIRTEPLDGLQTTREPLAMRSGAGRKIGSCIFKDDT